MPGTRNLDKLARIRKNSQITQEDKNLSGKKKDTLSNPQKKKAIREEEELKTSKKIQKRIESSTEIGKDKMKIALLERTKTTETSRKITTKIAKNRKTKRCPF